MNSGLPHAPLMGVVFGVSPLANALLLALSVVSVLIYAFGVTVRVRCWFWLKKRP